MAWTRHGHQIPGTPVEEPRPEITARCGGPGLCPHCSRDALAINEPNEVVYTEYTLYKVHQALVRAGLNSVLANEAIREMQNEGILFRERV